jgi:hypothetical protein
MEIAWQFVGRASHHPTTELNNHEMTHKVDFGWNSPVRFWNRSLSLSRVEELFTQNMNIKACNLSQGSSCWTQENVRRTCPTLGFVHAADMIFEGFSKFK